MNKKLRFLLALAMCFSMGVSAVACDLFMDSDSEANSEVTSEEAGSSEEVTSEEIGSSEEVTSEEGEVTDNEVGPKATVATANAETLAAFNAEGVTLYDLSNFQALETTVALETAYVFSVTETVEEAKASEYANWIADYYVSVDADVAAGNIGLAGSYESWDNGAWVAFYSPVDVEANQQIGLLESTGGTPWTYADVVEFVGTFRCGAFDLDNACAGVTLKVELRLTNPEDATDTISVCVTEYTFA